MTETGQALPNAIVAVALIALWGGYLYFQHTERKRRLEIIHQERLAAMDKGIPLPELPLDSRTAPKGTDPRMILIHGIAWTAMGLGGVVAMMLMGFHVNGTAVWPMALPLLFLGAGLILYYVLVPDRRR